MALASKTRTPATVNDVARLAGVSTATVSRAVNSPDIVAPDTRARVFDAIDQLEYRLEFARSYASCEAYNFRSLGDPVVFVKQTTGSLGADVCIDAVGAEAAGSAMQTALGRKLFLEGGAGTALHWAINSVKKGGVISIVGVYGPTDTLIPIGNVVNKGLTIRANQASVKRLLPRLLEHVQNGVLSPKALITHRMPLEEVSDAYRIFSEKLDNCIKTVLIPPSARTGGTA